MLARLLVLASRPTPHQRGLHLLRLLQSLSPSLHPRLAALWTGRFPLLLHYLEQHRDSVDCDTWQEWLLGLASDSLAEVDCQDFSLALVQALLDQIQLHPPTSQERAFCVLLAGQSLTKAPVRHQVSEFMSLVLVLRLLCLTGWQG